jgi:hypothetical protein
MQFGLDLPRLFLEPARCHYKTMQSPNSVPRMLRDGRDLSHLQNAHRDNSPPL